MNINGACVPNGPAGAGRPFPATATYKNLPTKEVFSRNFKGTDKWTIYVSDLDTMGPAVEGTQFCITLKKDAPCDTMAELMPEFPKWSVALWDPNHNCCPVSNSSNPSPPPGRPPRSPRLPPPPRVPRSPPPPKVPRSPPPPRTPRSPPPPRTPRSPPPPRIPRSPPPPRFPPPPAGCDTCYQFKVTPGPNQPVLNYFDNDANCARAVAVWDEYFFNNPVIKPFIQSGFQVVTCDGDTAIVCGTYVSTISADEAASLANFQLMLELVFQTAGGCPSNLAGYSLSLTSTKDECGAAFDIFTCTFPPPPFPNCGPCNNQTNSIPFAASQVITTRTASASSTYYCIGIDTQTPGPNTGEYAKYCAKLESLYKAEFWLDYSKRWLIKSIASFADDGTMTEWAATWGPAADNSLRVTPLKWDLDYVDANVPSICFELANSSGSILDITPRPTERRLWYSLFDEKQMCCPTSSSTTL
ncbi:hypothetical protein HYH03_011802 [Edaphochlamys debaryana]|uniref:Pherophorin domain-containing protein n=1 Tax=Edaphochlamys debaryana TaxID=47281 RepID=A0A835XSZ3_9CHLO|nr:hypothetical protein HYH03_011802 [Edaphochlamys debaryana]|eukprot:KAG2489693.1 hypothetical protein HYH03_011802 [Edaphochlamys debaryana]